MRCPKRTALCITRRQFNSSGSSSQASCLNASRSIQAASRVVRSGITSASGASSAFAVRTFEHRFDAATGYAPLDYVLSLRMEEAKQMLETSDEALDGVAEEAGYAEAAAFRRVFRRPTGPSPFQCRQKFRWVAVVERMAPVGEMIPSDRDASD
jgi:methylphosphotriester-DNA--protein-cysteine methyltransferase